MARKKLTELLELDEHGNVTGILATEAPVQEALDQAAADGRTLILRAGAPAVDEAELELMRLHDGDWKDATAEHREAIEAARADAEAAPVDRRGERLRALARKRKRTEAERDELLDLLLERAGVV